MQSETHQRILKARKYRNLSQKEVASWYGITAQSWGAKEKGEAAGFSPDDLSLFLQKTNIDARWLFGQIDCPIEEADLLINKPTTLTQELLTELHEFRKRNKPLKEMDPLAERVVIDESIRTVVKKLVQNRKIIDRVIGFIEGVESSGPEIIQDNGRGSGREEHSA